MVYGAKLEDRYKATDNVKVSVASATLMNKVSGRGVPKDQAWHHTAETRVKALEDDKLQVSPTLCTGCMLLHRMFAAGGAVCKGP